MSQNIRLALGLLALGILTGGWAALRIRAGKFYTLNPPMRVSRKDDPFSFWLPVIPMLAISVVLIVSGFFYVFHK
jgi:hypothetical protein